MYGRYRWESIYTEAAGAFVNSVDPNALWDDMYKRAGREDPAVFDAWALRYVLELLL